MSVCVCVCGQVMRWQGTGEFQTKWERERNVEGRVCGRTGTVLGRDGLKDEDAQQEQTDRLAPSWHRGAEGGKSFAVNTQSRAKEPTDRSLAMRRRNKVDQTWGLNEADP